MQIQHHHAARTNRQPYGWLWLLLALLPGLLCAEEPRAIRVILEGVEGSLHETLRNDLSIGHLRNDEYPAQTDFLFRRGARELGDALRAHGYYQARVSTHLERQERVAVVRYMVELGAPVLIRKVDLQILGTGADELAWREYRQFDLPLRRGQPMNHADYERTLSDLLNIAINHGYLDAHFPRKAFLVSPEKGEAVVEIVLDTGEPYLFGKVHFDGSSNMEHAFLRRYVEFRPGERFTNAQLSELQQALIGSRYFSLVRYEPRFAEQEDRQIPIHVQLKDNLPHRYRVGPGAGTDTGARLLFGFENRLVNQDGHRYEIDSVLGQRAQSVLFNYSVPGHRPSRQQWNLRTGWENSQSSYLKRRRTTLMPEYTHLTRNNWLLSPHISLENEVFRYRDQDNQATRLLLAGINLQQRVLNQSAYPGRGYRHNLALRLSQRNPVSDSEFTQLEIASKGIISPVDNWRLIARARLATTWSDDLEELPASYRYLLGGETLRGYAFESIGLRDDEGKLTGAKHMTLASLETDYRLTRWFGFAAFTDAGQVFQRGYDTELKVGSGIGLRGFTPVGVVRLDAAWAVSEEDKPLRFHLSLGLDL